MPKSHTYGASYPSGAVIAHDGEVLNTPDEGNDAPRIEDDSRPGGADSAPPIDQAAPDEKPAPDEDDASAKPTKRTARNQR